MLGGSQGQIDFNNTTISTILYIIRSKYRYFTNLRFPEKREFPFINYLLGWRDPCDVAVIWPDVMYRWIYPNLRKPKSCDRRGKSTQRWFHQHPTMGFPSEKNNLHWFTKRTTDFTKEKTRVGQVLSSSYLEDHLRTCKQLGSPMYKPWKNQLEGECCPT